MLKRKIKFKSFLQTLICLIFIQSIVSQSKNYYNRRRLQLSNNYIIIEVIGKGKIQFINLKYGNFLIPSTFTLNNIEFEPERSPDCYVGGEICGYDYYVNINSENDKNIIKVEFSQTISNLEYMFSFINSIISIDLSNFDTSDISIMDSMFSGCSSLVSLNLNNFDTSNVRNMADLFSWCKSLISIDLSHINTNNVVNMNSMFNGCESLTSLDLSNFDTSKVTEMISMFSQCYSLTTLDLSNFKTSKITYIRYMFDRCTSLISLDLSNFDTSNVIYMEYMFRGCNSLKNLNILNFNTSTVKYMQYMFSGCASLISLNLNHFNTLNVLNMEYMFSGCTALKELKINNFQISNIENFEFMFENCYSLISLDLFPINITNFPNFVYMFKNCFSLTSIKLTNFYQPYISKKYSFNMAGLFYGCDSLVSVDLYNFNTSYAQNMSYLFSGCSSLKSLNLNYLETPMLRYAQFMFSDCTSLIDLNINELYFSNVNNMKGIFSGCKSLKEINLDKLDTSNVENMAYMFSECISLISLNFNLTTLKVKVISYMFNECVSLISLNLNNFDTSQVTNMEYIFNDCSSLTSINLTNFNTSKTTNMKGLFSGCSSLFFLNLSNFDTSKVTTMEYMFNDCINLKGLYLDNLNTLNVKNMGHMFSGCISIISLNITNFNTSMVTNMEYMFSDCRLIKILNISNFNTSIVTKMKGMFKYCNSLFTLDLSNFEVSNVINLKNIFDSCESLEFINIYNFKKTAIMSIDNMFDKVPENIVYCIKNTSDEIALPLYSKICAQEDCSENWKEKQKKIIVHEDKCIDNCNNDIKYIFQYGNKCYSNCPEGTHLINNSHTCIKNIIDSPYENNYIEKDNGKNDCKLNELFKGKCNLNNINEKNIVNFIIKKIKEGELNLMFLNNSNQMMDDYILKEDNIIYQITSTFDQNNKYYQNLSTIILNQCEKILKDKYKINQNDSLIIFKYEYFIYGLYIPIINYEVFYNNTLLDLNLCREENIHINLNIPVAIDENKLFIYNQSDQYYKDICISFESDFDLTIFDRKKEFNNNNLSLCQKNCSFIEYDKNSKKVLCECELINETSILSDNYFNFNVKELLNEFVDFESKSNIGIMKCYKTFFSKTGFINNIGSYLLLLIIIFFLTFLIIFYYKEQKTIINNIINIMTFKTSTKSINNITTYNSNNKVMKKDIKKNTIIKKKKKCEKKNKKLEIFKIKNNISNNSFSCNNKEIKHLNQSDETIICRNISFEFLGRNNIDYEINNFSYNEALAYDNRNYFQYYISLLKIKNIFIFSFCLADYNSKMIKVNLFLFFISLYFVINALFFTDETMHQIYEDKGDYNLIYSLPPILYSTIISSTISSIIKYLSLFDAKIMEFKKDKTKDYRNLIKILKIRFLCFYIISCMLLIIFWYYIGCFCSVYKNTQLHLIKDTIISFLTSLVDPFILCLIPSCIRIISLKKKNKFFYILSKIIQNLI